MNLGSVPISRPERVSRDRGILLTEATEIVGHAFLEFIPLYHYLFVSAGGEIEFKPDALRKKVRRVGMLIRRPSRSIGIDERIGGIHHGNGSLGIFIGIGEKEGPYKQSPFRFLRKVRRTIPR